ncbi:MAG: beta-hydroxyacyl-ACP dehydratase [Myxococcota bacterium]|nr:beta-hydroxyacyl-ACP dehydratase [Myxococcota bacterium]
MASPPTPAEILGRIPQQEPFRFVDEILEIDADHAVGAYTWREDHDFYRGHFPGEPVTPGVLLIECMAQTGVVPLALYLGAESEKPGLPFFTDAAVDFSGVVRPGTRVIVRSKKLFYRRGKLRAESEMRTEDGALVCSGTLSGMEVSR